MSANLMDLLPRIKRARDFYLYDEKGNRFLDLYLDGGRALCGHRPNGLSNTLKNAVSRGIYAPYPSVYEERLIKVLRKGFPRFTQLGLYRSIESFHKATAGKYAFIDPVCGDENNSTVLWRPYLSLHKENETILVSLPYPGVDTVAVLSSRDELPPSDRISPVIQAGLVRSWFDLQITMKEQDRSGLDVLDGTGDWSRKGPYLMPRCGADEYPDLFRRYLKAGILISPVYDCPSICVAQIREGSLKKIGGPK